MSLSNTFSPAPTGVTSQGSSVSNREDLTDVLTVLAPEETPVLSSASKQKANSTFVEWTVDTLADVSTDGISEGSDITSFTDKFSKRARLGNYIQKFRKDYLVSDLQEAVDSVGPAKVAQAEAKAIRELKRNVEATLISDNEMSSEDGAGTPYKLRGLGKWLQNGAQATNAVPSDFRTSTDSIHASGAFTESVLNNLITSIYRETGTTESLTLIADTALRRKISDFARFGADKADGTEAGVRRVSYAGNEAQITLSVEVYQSDHGMVSIVNMNPDCAPDTSNKDTGYLINPEYFGVSELIPMGSTRLPNLGAGERGYVDCALTSLVYHPQAHGKITAIA
tara:strand:- start:6097 stop:7113 length:1017 start_codon:yes stop_codon:yes gene_type:complete